MNKVFADTGWEDYTYWQTEDRKTLKKINQLINDICRNGNEGIGKPEPLSGNLSGYWSRRINDKDRLIYKIDEENVYILACRVLFIPASNEPSGCACTSIRRLPRGSNTPQLSCVTSLMPRQLAAGYLTTDKVRKDDTKWKLKNLQSP